MIIVSEQKFKDKQVYECNETPPFKTIALFIRVGSLHSAFASPASSVGRASDF